MDASLLILAAWLAQADAAPASAGSPASPPSFGDTLVVTASHNEERLTDAVAPTSVLTRQDLDRSPG